MLSEFTLFSCNSLLVSADCGGGGSWQGRAPSPGMPISFTQENSIRPPSSPLHFSDYFDDHTGFDEVLNSEWLHSGGDCTISFSQDEASASHLPQPMQGYTDGSIMQPNDLPNHPHLGSWTFNQLLELDTPPNSQTPRDIGYPVQPNELVSHHQHFENEMLRNNKDEQVARLVTKIEMLRKEIASIKHNNLPNH
ncbi:hypothetical protein V6N13_132883 [Hibiscus sabdariffa]